MMKRLLASHDSEALNQSKRIVLFSYLTLCLKHKYALSTKLASAQLRILVCRKDAFTRRGLVYSVALKMLMRILKDNLLIVFTDSVTQTRFNLNNQGRVCHRKVSIKVLRHIRCYFPVKSVT